jgi:hypothetical protein
MGKKGEEKGVLHTLGGGSVFSLTTGSAEIEIILFRGATAKNYYVRATIASGPEIITPE